MPTLRHRNSLARTLRRGRSSSRPRRRRDPSSNDPARARGVAATRPRTIQLAPAAEWASSRRDDLGAAAYSRRLLAALVELDFDDLDACRFHRVEVDGGRVPGARDSFDRTSASRPWRRGDPSPRTIHVAAAASTRLVTTEYPRGESTRPTRCSRARGRRRPRSPQATSRSTCPASTPRVSCT